ncbi:hypothetical protein [Shewanella surugensis]|uniref:Protein kinase domain-containing protein n=1 Tax=Shewanella surugensis TaxID=212020 RepID=A0ABT0LHE8_9GAMM|nr:hypothetical protein [Shewanella surugensis]MCL1126775.1 hypothetical protein [Shewanella surugensis]
MTINLQSQYLGHLTPGQANDIKATGQDVKVTFGTGLLSKSYAVSIEGDGSLSFKRTGLRSAIRNFFNSDASHNLSKTMTKQINGQTAQNTTDLTSLGKGKNGRVYDLENGFVRKELKSSESNIDKEAKLSIEAAQMNRYLSVLCKQTGLSRSELGIANGDAIITHDEQGTPYLDMPKIPGKPLWVDTSQISTSSFPYGASERFKEAINILNLSGIVHDDPTGFNIFFDSKTERFFFIDLGSTHLDTAKNPEELNFILEMNNRANAMHVNEIKALERPPLQPMNFI